MADGTGPTWDDVADELAARLPRLNEGDTLSIDVGRSFVQFRQVPRELLVISSGADDRARDMAALGWRPPSRRTPTHSLSDLPRPMPADTARRVARLLVATLRDVHGAATPAAATFSSFNDEGHRAPTLRTVAMSPDQQPEVRPVPATLLPAPAPIWQEHLEALLAGVGGWSRAAVGAVFARCGWEITEDDRWGLAAAGGGLEASALRAYEGDADFTEVTVRERVAPAGAGSRFREVLAAAVTVLGDPPLVGGPGAFARWRGTPLTVIVSRRARRRGDSIELTVTPTDVVETEEQRAARYDPGWRPEHSWTTLPDTDAPEHRTLTGMVSFPHPPAADLDRLGEDLRQLFGSLTADLPLLHPYASSACIRIIGPAGDRLAEAALTLDEARVSVGAGTGRAETFPLDGARTGAAIADRITGALVAAGVTAPEQLRGLAWSETPAERFRADGLTIPRR